MNRLGLLGKKVGMTRIFLNDGRITPVTVVQAGPCPIMQIKNKENDGYEALQIAYDQVPEKKINQPEKGHQKRAEQGWYKTLREFKVDDSQEYEVGQELKVDLFQIGDKVKVQGKSKGRGFAGVMKRWNFRGSPSSHGHHKVHRKTGAVGQCADPARVFKGKKMPGRMGNKKLTVTDLEILDIRNEDNVILLRGTVPGPKNAPIMIHKQS